MGNPQRTKARKASTPPAPNRASFELFFDPSTKRETLPSEDRAKKMARDFPKYEKIRGEDIRARINTRNQIRKNLTRLIQNPVIARAAAEAITPKV